MRIKLIQRNKSISLRRKGFSLSEISTKLGVSKGSVSLWVREVPISKKASHRIAVKRQYARSKAAEARRELTSMHLKQAEIFAKDVLKYLPMNARLARFVAALLYWCEGEKSENDNTLIFTNSDPGLVKAFLEALRRGYNINEGKFRVCVHLHSYHKPKKQLLFWSKVTTISLTQFIKPYQKLHSGKNIRVGYAGCASVRYHDVRIARQVQAVARVFLNKGPIVSMVKRRSPKAKFSVRVGVGPQLV